LDGQGFGVLVDSGNHNWSLSNYIDMNLGIPQGVLDVNNAQAIAFTPDLRYAFVTGFDRYVQGLNSTDLFINPLNPAGGNVGIIYNPFNLDFQDGLLPRDPMIAGLSLEDVDAKLLAATRPTPLSFPDNLVVSPDGALLYVAFKGQNVIVAYSIPEIIKQVEFSYNRSPRFFGKITYATDRFAVNDLLNETVQPNNKIDVKSDYRLIFTGVFAPTFVVPDKDPNADGIQNDRAPIATGFAPQGLAA
jgi:hypothetical protein